MHPRTTEELFNATVDLQSAVRLWSEHGGPRLPENVETAMDAVWKALKTCEGSAALQSQPSGGHVSKPLCPLCDDEGEVETGEGHVQRCSCKETASPRTVRDDALELAADRAEREIEDQLQLKAKFRCPAEASLRSWLETIRALRSSPTALSPGGDVGLYEALNQIVNDFDNLDGIYELKRVQEIAREALSTFESSRLGVRNG